MQDFTLWTCTFKLGGPVTFKNAVLVNLANLLETPRHHNHEIRKCVRRRPRTALQVPSSRASHRDDQRYTQPAGWQRDSSSRLSLNAASRDLYLSSRAHLTCSRSAASYSQRTRSTNFSSRWPTLGKIKKNPENVKIIWLKQPLISVRPPPELRWWSPH